MGSFHMNSGYITGYAVQQVTEPNGHHVVHVTIDTDLGSHKFRISTDDRHPNLSLIVNDLNIGLGAASNDRNAHFQINEYAERSYLFVNYPNGTQHQYTGQKLR